jgi:hypothetical protein
MYCANGAPRRRQRGDVGLGYDSNCLVSGLVYSACIVAKAVNMYSLIASSKPSRCVAFPGSPSPYNFAFGVFVFSISAYISSIHTRYFFAVCGRLSFNLS